MIRSLLWKEFRLATPALLTGLLLFVASFVSIHLLARSMTPGPFPWIEAIVASLHFCQWSMVLAGALLGGGAFATEREDRSALFVHSLPMRARDALLGKLVVSLLIMECMWLFIALVLHASVPYAAMGARDRLPGAADLTTIASISFAAFGAAWCWSPLVSKPLLSALNGLLSAAIVLSSVFVVNRAIAAAGTVTLDSLMPWAAGLGAVGLVAGSAFYSFGERNNSSVRFWRVASNSNTQRDPVAGERRAGAFATLIWKDWRLGRAVFAAGTILIAAPYGIALAALVRAEDALASIAYASTQSLWLSCPVFALWGGYIVSAERASRTDQFVLSLPVTSSKTAQSRLMLTFVPAAAIFLVNVGVMILMHSLTFRESPVDEPVGGLFRMTWTSLVWQANSLMFAIPTLGMPLLCFGTAWFGAVRFAKPFLGIGLGVAMPGLVLVCWLSFITLVQEAVLPMTAAILFLLIGAVAGLVLVAAGYRLLVRFEVN